ncbi:hypothetical protein UPYG_G00030420 [Umbra pygmaea]|uniref:Uncharacterized protein n=1 Tax=Umbra pygmaea TaxID=75934 RepID=A0ABD0XMM1_UMBPY
MKHHRGNAVVLSSVTKERRASLMHLPADDSEKSMLREPSVLKIFGLYRSCLQFLLVLGIVLPSAE